MMWALQDVGIGYLTKNIPEETPPYNKIILEWDSNMAYTYWGGGTQVMLEMSDGSKYTFLHRTSEYGYGDWNAFIINTPDTPQNAIIHTYPSEYNDFHNKITFNDNEVQFVVTRISDGVTVLETIDDLSLESFLVSDIRIVTASVHSTNNDTVFWLDNLYFEYCADSQKYSDKVATPTFSPAPGTYNSLQNVTISCSTEGATIHYTEDGTEPIEASPIYNSSIEIPMNTTKIIKARAFKTGWVASDILEGAYTITSEQEPATLAIYLKEGIEPEYYEVDNTIPLKAILKDMDGNSADVGILLAWTSSDPKIAEVSSSGLVTFKAEGSVTITATGGGLIAQKTFKVGVLQEITKHYGNLIIVAGGGLSETDTLKDAIQYLCNRMYQVFKMRGFEDGDIFYINPQPVQDLDGNGQNDGIVDSSDATVAQLQSAINWAASQSNDGPLYIYLMDHGGDQTFRMGPSAILTATQLDASLDGFESGTLRESIVMIEACHSGTFVEPLTDSDRLIITSTDSKVAYLSLHGDISFSQILSTNLLKGMAWEEAFENTKIRLTQMGMPYNSQKPQIHTGQDIVASYIGGEFALADFLPFISDYTKSKGVTANIDHDFSIVVDTLNISGLNVWATVTPPLYQPPQVTEDFETPTLGLDTFDFTNQSGTLTFNGTYSFTYNGTYKLTYYVKDKNNNVVSSPPVEIIVTGGTDPSYQNSIGANWNLLSLPVVPTDSSVNAVLTDVKDNISSAWKWENSSWAVYLPGEDDGGAAYAQSKGFALLTDIEPGEGFWVNCIKAVELQ